MNETLRILALHAGFPRAGFDSNGFTLFNQQEIERLAYQIVQECAELVDVMGYTGKQLKEHFGVSK